MMESRWLRRLAGECTCAGRFGEGWLGVFEIFQSNVSILSRALDGLNRVSHESESFSKAYV